MTKNALAKHGTVFDCGPVMSDAKACTVPGQMYFGDTAPDEFRALRCHQCAHFRKKEKKGSKPKGEGNALKATKETHKGFCQLYREAMRKAVEFRGDKALPCKYFEIPGQA